MLIVRHIAHYNESEENIESIINRFIYIIFASFLVKNNQK